MLRKLIFSTALLIALGLGLGAVPTQAASNGNTIIVTSTADKTGGPQCTLRDAITAANKDKKTGGCDAGQGADTLELWLGATYTLTVADASGRGLPDVTSNITIHGNGATIERDFFAPEFGFLYVTDTGHLTLINATLRGGKDYIGGAIYNSGTLDLDSATFGDNESTQNDGGAIFDNGTLHITYCTFSGNKSASVGGALSLSSNNQVTIDHSTFFQNSAALWGGAIHRGGGTGALVLSDSNFHNNSAKSGGAIYNENDSTITTTTFSTNSAKEEGGAIWSPGSLTLARSTFYGNSGGDGGAIYVITSATVSNSTFLANSSDANGHGGALYSASQTEVVNSTFSNNLSPHGGALYNGGNLTLTNSIVANSLQGKNCSGDIYDGYGNVRWPTTDSSCVGLVADPKLGVLADNGGPTLTMALSSGSAAFDAGMDLSCANDPVGNIDQRGVERPQGAHCDSGAYEGSSNPKCTTKPDRALLLKPGDKAVVTATKIKLDWTDTACATRYKVRVRQDSKHGIGVFKKTLTKSRAKISALATGHNYYWFVKACNSFGCKKSEWRYFTHP